MNHKLTNTLSHICSFRHILLLLLLFSFQAIFNELSAQQVVVGTSTKGEKAAVLQIKTNDITTEPNTVDDDNNVTSETGGLGLPRVKLIDKTTLEPFILTSDPDWDDSGAAPTAKKKTGMKHAGLMVYNINVSDGDTGGGVIDLNKKLKQGVYVWDGSRWSLVGEGSGQRFFYMPAFNLPLDEISADIGSNPATRVMYDLYAEYAKQFTDDPLGSDPLFARNPAYVGSTVPSPDNTRLYGRRELDYAVIYYDADIIQVDEITDDGEMYYWIIDNDPGPESFVNIVFIIKE